MSDRKRIVLRILCGFALTAIVAVISSWQDIPTIWPQPEPEPEPDALPLVIDENMMSFLLAAGWPPGSVLKEVRRSSQYPVELRAKARTVPRSTMQVGDKLFAQIGFVDGIDTNAQRLIWLVLKANGIRCIMDGSVGYGLSVPVEHVDKALRILEKDSEEKHYWIRLEW